MTPTWLPRRGGAPGPDTEPEPDPAPAPGADFADAPAEPQTAESGSVASGSVASAGGASGEGLGEVPGRRGPGGRLRQVALAGTAAVLVLGGCGFFYAAHQLGSQAPARNHALTDTGATSRVAGDVGNALARIFSYTPDGTAAAQRSANTVLDGRAARQYETLFARVRDDLTEQRVTLSTRAVRTGVIELDGDRARLLVFLDQTSHRNKGKATTAAAQLTVTARLDDDRWRIVDIKAR
ncbi:Mce-associated membrane protein OS=Streptomyces tendae OX=1932 GN=GUR47_10390 PE=4 SV=1 [Streptomyces tendae]